jgi:chemotaxis protein MotB
MAKAKPAKVGAPDWIVTFADLMSLLVCFFVLIISFSIQDTEKLQIVAGSMRDAFGVQKVARKAGMIELEGMPVRPYVREIGAVHDPTGTDFANERNDLHDRQGPEANTHEFVKADIERPRNFALAAASLRQAWSEMPEIAELADNILLEETPEGLNIQLLDQDGRAMFEPGTATPKARTRRLLARVAPVLAGLPNRIQITGHTDATRRYSKDGYTQWELSADRASAARRILADNGVPHDHFFAITGKADTEPLFPDDAFLAANRRVTILLMSEEPPMPPDHRP